MKILITIRYSEMEIPPRCLKPRAVNHEEQIEVSIKEVSESKVKTAFIVREFNKEPQKVILYQGRLYSPFQDRNDGRANGEPLWQNVTAEKVNWKRRLEPYNHYDTKSERLKFILSVVRDFLIVDGWVFSRCYEPYYSVTCFGLGNNHGGTALFVNWSDASSRKNRGWSALEKGRAIAGAVNIALGRGDDKSVDSIRKCVHGTIEVLIPEAVKRIYSTS